MRDSRIKAFLIILTQRRKERKMSQRCIMFQKGTPKREIRIKNQARKARRVRRPHRNTKSKDYLPFKEVGKNPEKREEESKRIK